MIKLKYTPIGRTIVVEIPKTGDIVIPKGQGFMVKIEDKEYFQMDLYNVLGIVG